MKFAPVVNLTDNPTTFKFRRGSHTSAGLGLLYLPFVFVCESVADYDAFRVWPGWAFAVSDAAHEASYVC